MKQSFEEFSKQVRSKPKEYKIKNSWGVYDYYKYYRKNKPKDRKFVLTESQYFAIIRRTNQMLAENLLNYSFIQLPLHFGRIEIRKIDATPRIGRTGEKIHNRIVDWDKTLKLWYEDPQAYTDRILIRHECRDIFKVVYNKSKAIYTHKSYYLFKTNDTLQSRISQKARDGRLDAYPLYIDNND